VTAESGNRRARRRITRARPRVEHATTLRERLRRLVPGVRAPVPRGRVAVLRLHGPIGGAGRTAEWIELARRLRQSRRVPAVVLDIASPGG